MAGGKDEKRKKDRKRADDDVVLVEDKMAIDGKEKETAKGKKKKKSEGKKKGSGLSGFFGFGKDKKKEKEKEKQKASKVKLPKKKEPKPAKTHSAEAIAPKKPKKEKKHRKPESAATITAPTSSGQTLSIDTAALPKKSPAAKQKMPKNKVKTPLAAPTESAAKKSGSQELAGSKPRSSDELPLTPKQAKPEKQAKKKRTSKESMEKKDSKPSVSFGKDAKNLAKLKDSKEGSGSMKRSDMSDSTKKPFAADLKISGSEKLKHSKETKSGSGSGRKVFNDVAVGSEKKNAENASQRTNPISDRFPLGKSVHLTSSPKEKKSTQRKAKASSGESMASSSVTKPSSAEIAQAPAKSVFSAESPGAPAVAVRRVSSGETTTAPSGSTTRRTSSAESIPMPIRKQKKEKISRKRRAADPGHKPRSHDGTSEANCSMNGSPRLPADKTPPSSKRVKRSNKSESNPFAEGKLAPDSTPPSSPREKKPWVDEIQRKKKSSHHKKARMLPPDSTPPSSREKHSPDENTQKSTPRPEPTESTQISTKPRRIVSLNVEEVIKIGHVLDRHGLEPDRRKAYEWLAKNRDRIDKEPATAAHFLLTAMGDLPMSKELVQQTLKFMVTREIITKEEYKKHFKKMAIDSNNPMTVVQLAHLLTVYVDAYKHSGSVERS